MSRPDFYNLGIALWYTFEDILKACPRAKRREKVYPKLIFLMSRPDPYYLY